MLNEKEYLKIISKYISEKELYEIYKSKYINNFGIKCLKIEHIKANKEKLKENLLKPANKRHFEKWLFAHYKYSQKEDNNPDDHSDYKMLFDQLIKAYFDKQKEKFDECSLKLKELFQNEASIESKDDHKIGIGKIKEKAVEDTKIVKKLEDKINNLQKELQKRESTYKTLKDRQQKKIDILANEIKKMQSELSKKDEQIRKMKFTENDILTLKMRNNDLESKNKRLNSEILTLKNNLEDISKKEVEVIGLFNTDLAINKNIKVTFLDIDKMTDLKIISGELWILEYTLTPKEKFKVENILKNVPNKNNIIKISSYNDLLKNINISNYKGLEVF